jgi:lysine N6-hydroxylase
MTRTFHTVGIGAGPANLSLAAMYGLLEPHEMALFEAHDGPGWHSGMLHSGVRMQTGWVKDLVSLYDPTHPLTFLNYLVTTGRVYALLGAGFDTIPRIEYEHYLAWAAQQLPNVHYGAPVDRVSVDEGMLVCCSGSETVARSQHLSIGIGTVPHLPEFVADLDPRRVFLADDLTWRLADAPADPATSWVVVGSGQTSAECVSALLARGYDDIRWMGRRSWFAPLEDSPSANDLYRPAYQQFFLDLPLDARESLVSGQILTSDGISPGTLRGLYQANYEERLRTGRYPVTVMPSRTVVSARQIGDEIELDCLAAGGEDVQRASHVVIAAGRRPAPLPFDDELFSEVELDEIGEPIIESDYSIRWKRSDEHMIFVLNRGRYVQGLVDSNLSILPVRSAMILNAIAGHEVCPVHDDFVSTAWA